MSQEINLYEERLRPNRDLLSGRRLGAALLTVFVLLAVFGVVTRLAADRSTAELVRLQDEVKAGQQKLAELGKTLAARKISASLKDEIENAKAQLASRQAVMALLDSGQLGNSTGFFGVMAGFSRLASNDLWLTAFSVGAGGQEVEIRGRLLDASRLPAYVQRLGSEPAFKGLRFATLDIHQPDAASDKAPAGGAPSANDPADASTSRYVEFVLRSENAAEPSSPAGGKK